MRKIDEIIIHCTATHPGWWSSKTAGQKIAEIRKWHIHDRGWKDIGYHFLIDRDGKIGAGRPIENIGAHTVGKNSSTLGISLFGGYDSASTDIFSDNFTAHQEESLRTMIKDLCAKFPINKVSGHNDYAAKACPGFKVSSWI